MEESKNQLKIMTKKSRELETAEALTKWKLISNTTTIESLKKVETDLRQQINELKKINNEKEHKITSNIQLCDETTEEMNSYKVRYVQNQKELQDTRNEVLRYKSSYEMTKQSLKILTSKYNSLEEKYNGNHKEATLHEMHKFTEELTNKIKNLNSLNTDLKAERDILKMKIDNKEYTSVCFGGVKLFDNQDKPATDTKGELTKYSSLEESSNFIALKSRVKSISTNLEQKELDLSQQIRVNQKLAFKIKSLESQLEAHSSSTQKCTVYYKEIQKIKNENRELTENLMDLLKENSGLIQAFKSIKNDAFDYVRPNHMLIADGTKKIRETYIEKIIKENAMLRDGLRQHQHEDHENTEVSNRFERKRDRKEQQKDSDYQDSQSEIKQPVSVRDKILEKRKNELEDELLTTKKQLANFKEHYEVEIYSFKNRLESTDKNYQVLQKELQNEKQK
jgi:hypothetical protein